MGTSSNDNRDVVSFFSGAMGLDIGLEKAGLNIKVGQDFDSDCVDTMKANGQQVAIGNIRDIKPEEILELAGLAQGQPFLVCGGPPCQPFSTAGKRLGINDPRGSLFMDFIRMIDHIRPRFFIMENVKGLMSAPLKNESEIGVSRREKSDTVLDVVLSEFSHLGYKTVCGVLDAASYGVPQFRERFILIGSRDKEDIFLPVPTHFQTHQNAAHRWQVLGSAIRDLENSGGECASFGEERTALLRLVPEGGNWRDLPSNVVQRAMGGAFKSFGGKVGFYRRLSYKQPSPTLVTSPIQKASMLCHPIQDRPLSVREYARIQQFPDDWYFAGSVASKYRQIGNAVPVGLGEALGQAIISVADGTAEIKSRRVRGTSIHTKLQQAMEFRGDQDAN